jgi:hypothetical protein
MPINISRVLLLSSSALVSLGGFGEVARAQEGQTDIKIEQPTKADASHRRMPLIA